MIIYISKGKFQLKKRLNGYKEPSVLVSAILSQFVRCSYIEERLPFQERIIFLN